jgi:two-component system, NarL family, sensor histidine kinase DesK
MPRRWEMLGRGFMLLWVVQIVLTIQTMGTFHLPIDIFVAQSVGLIAVGVIHAWYWSRVAGSGVALAGMTALGAMLVVVTAIELASPAGTGIGLYLFAAVLAGAAFSWKRSWIAILLVALVTFAQHQARGTSLPLSTSDAVQSALIGLLAAGARYAVIAQTELARTRAELARLAVLAERNRFARDLHDTLGQGLTLIVLKAEVVSGLLESGQVEASRQVSEIAQVARESLARARSAVSGYRQPSLADELRHSASALAAAGIAVHQDVAADDIPEAIRSALAWAVREGTTNILRHSVARKVDIKIRRSRDNTELQIVDDGDGPSAVRFGNGLDGLRERAHALGGELTVGRRPPTGFQLRLDLPTPK